MISTADDLDLEEAVCLVHNQERIIFNPASRSVYVAFSASGIQDIQIEYFPVNKYGSWVRAARAAIFFEEGLSDYARAGRHRPRAVATVTSVSGIVGISPSYNRRDFSDIRGWIASWVEPDPTKKSGVRQRTKVFSYSTQGPRAKEMAIAYREEKLREHHPYMFEVA